MILIAGKLDLYIWHNRIALICYDTCQCTGRRRLTADPWDSEREAATRQYAIKREDVGQSCIEPPQSKGFPGFSVCRRSAAEIMANLNPLSFVLINSSPKHRCALSVSCALRSHALTLVLSTSQSSASVRA